MDTRSCSQKQLLEETYFPEPAFVLRPKLQTGKFLIGRMLHLCGRSEEGKKNISKQEGSIIAANELRDDWISKNIYPMHERAAAKKILDTYQHFLELRKTENNRTKTKTESWLETTKNFNETMKNRAFNIRCGNVDYERKLEEQYGVKMTATDMAFYNDNCFGAFVATCTDTVPRNWIKQKNRTKERFQAMKTQKLKALSEEEQQNLIKQEELRSALETVHIDADSEPSVEFSCNIDEKQHKTRTFTKTADECNEDEGGSVKFPQIKVRSKRKTLDEPLMRFLVQCLSQYKVTTADLVGITVQLANTVFGQNWMESRFEEDEEGDNCSSDDELDSSGIHCSNKRKRHAKDYSLVMPSRKTIMAYLEGASFMNLEMVAKHLMNKQENVVTIGIDDTTKAAGHRILDVKTDHITVSGPNMQRKSFTTGLTENISHSGKDGAKAVNHKLKCLSILADTSTEDMKAMIDFWISDRAGDCKVLLNTLDVEAEKILKCCAHLILGVDNAVDKAFRDAEQKVGISQLIECDRILKSSSSSVHTVGLIAISKLLSPSHAAHSVSLYGDFMEWMQMKGYETQSFRGFTANRFGRIAELAKIYLQLKDRIQEFFDDFVDSNANKLVLAVSTFTKSDWFQCCTEVYSLIGEIVIFPIMSLLGIDKRGDSHVERNWIGVRDFFKQKTDQLKKLSDRFAATLTGKGKLIGLVMKEILDTITRQLGEMAFFEENLEIDLEKMKYAPLTNLGCESQFARLDNKVRCSGGLTNVSTFSKKSIIATNGFLVEAEFVNSTNEEKRLKWKWARQSEEVLEVKQLEKDFLENVKVVKVIALKKKEELKKKKTARTFAILDQCTKHGGPITTSNIDLLPKLKEKELLSEIAFLRITVAPDIRQKRRIRQENGSYRYKTFSNEELIRSIKDVVKPENKVDTDIDALLKRVLE